MKVALFTDSDVFAGTERHILDLALGLRAEGVAPSILCPAVSVLAERACAEGLRVVAVEKGRGMDFRAVRALASMLRHGEVELIHSHNGRTAWLAACARIRARRGILITTQHFLAPARLSRTGLAGFASRWLHRWVLARASRTIAISESVRATMLARREMDPGKIRVVLNGICEPKTEALESREAIRARLGISQEAPLVVCVARLEREKNIGTLLQAMRLVLLERPDTRCVVAGGGVEFDSLQSQIRDAGLSHAIRLLGFQADAPALMRAGDVFVLPSAAEPFGLVLLEAMALGLPVVATRAGGPVEIVADGDTGLLVKPGDAGELAEALTCFLGNPAWARGLGTAGRRRFLTHFTVGHMARRMLEVYRECTPRPTAAGALSDNFGQTVSSVCR